MSHVKSIDGHTIRLTDKRWQHISTGHPEVADFYYDILQTIAEPQIVYDGGEGELIAVKPIEGLDKFIVVVYRQLPPNDGFVITAFVTRKLNYLSKKRVVWQSLK
jgi:hypothetical protein